jgi:RNA polymerase sigma-70 factor (ECF subfamily)
MPAARAASTWRASADGRQTAPATTAIVARMTTQSEPADAELVARYAGGDQAAARALTYRHAPRLHALARRMLGDGAEAEDVTQEAMLRLWRVAPGWDDRAAVSTWLYRVASNLCIDRLRRRKLISVARPEVADAGPGALGRLEAQDRAAALRAALALLPERQRLAVVLRHFEDRPNPEIAAILETSVEAVESLLARARRTLAAELAPRKAELGFTDG